MILLRYFSIALFFTIISLQLKAGGLQLNQQGASATAMGGSLTALAIDGSVVFYNTGGMVFLKKNSILAGTTLLLPKSAYLSSVSGKVTSAENVLQLPVYLYGSFFVDEKFAVGISVNNPFGATIKWPADWEGRYISHSYKWNTLYLQPSFSFKLSEKIGWGAGLVLAKGKLEATKDIPVETSSTANGIEKLKGNGNGIGFSSGLHFQADDAFSLGISYRSKVKFNLKNGEATYTAIPVALAANYPSSTDFSTKKTMPSVLSIAAAYKVTKEWTLSLESNYTGWSSSDSITYSFSNSDVASVNQANNMKNTFTFRLGSHYNVSKKIDLMAGVAYDQSPVKNEFLSPDLPDANKFIFAAGMTLKVSEAFHLTASYVFETKKERQATNQQTQLTGSYNSLMHGAGIGIHIKF
jgi:long-chain fatty acid transport protein